MRYDKILRRQHEILYGARNRLLDRAQIDRETMWCIISDALTSFVQSHPDLQEHELTRYVLDNLSYELDPEILTPPKDPNELLRRMQQYAAKLYDRKISTFDQQEQAQDYMRQCILRALDDGWVEEVDYLQQLQYAITTRGTAQRNPVFEYSREAYHSFEDMKETMKKNITRNFFLGDPETDANGQMNIIFP